MQHDILTLTISGDFLYSGSADGMVQRWDKAFSPAGQWHAHDNIVLASATTSSAGRKLLTGGNDNKIQVWDVHEDERGADHGMSKGFQGAYDGAVLLRTR